MFFGERLKKLRLDAGLSQAELARQLGVTRRSIIYYESGKRYPKTRDIITRTATLFGVSLDYLICDKDEFVLLAGEKYGDSGMREATELIGEVGALFAGGTLDDDDKDKVFKAISDIYWESKEINKKYSVRSDNNK
ncbi:MAG: helix-turn-helix transcriptional regulator [Clostridia bacterium]|nr:helix-turn-helix transcriptional regulator [Clostridia bacterium]